MNHSLYLRCHEPEIGRDGCAGKCEKYIYNKRGWSIGEIDDAGADRRAAAGQGFKLHVRF